MGPLQAALERLRSCDELYQKLPTPHYLLTVEPDVEIATDAIDNQLGSFCRPKDNMIHEIYISTTPSQ